MSLLDAFLPFYELREVDHVALAANPEAAWSAVRAIDFFRIPFARNLFAIRLLPERVKARLRGAPSGMLPTLTIDDIVRDGTAFRILAEVPGQEIVVGAVGKVWQPRIEFARVTPETFASFAEPGFAKLAWSAAVAPRSGGAWITIDLRVATTDPDAYARFRRYWRFIGRFSHWMRRSAASLLAAELGRGAPDESVVLAGDDLLPDARAQVTHHVDIEAPPAQVWPWLVQMGRGRAGWYSWDLLDNGGEPSADRIVASLQKITVGDVLPVKPNAPEGFAVLALDEPRSLVLGDPSLLHGKAMPAMGTPRATWAFSLEPIGDTGTHLVVRVRAEYEPSFTTALLRPVVTGVHDVMERKQLRTLKQRAEAR